MPDEGRTPGNYIFSGFEIMCVPLAAYVLTRVIAHFGPNWRSEVQKRYKKAQFTDGRLNRDVIMNLRIMEHCWKEVFKSVLERKSLNYIRELCDNRNDHSHQQPHSIDDAARILETMALLKDNIKADKAVATLHADIDACVAALKELRKELRAKLSDVQNQPPPEPPAPVWVNSPPQPPYRQTPPARTVRRKYSKKNVGLILEELRQRTFYTKSEGIRHFICQGFTNREIAEAYTEHTGKFMPPRFPNNVRRKMRKP